MGRGPSRLRLTPYHAVLYALSMNAAVLAGWLVREIDYKTITWAADHASRAVFTLILIVAVFTVGYMIWHLVPRKEY